MIIEALWQGEEAEREQRVTAEELAALSRHAAAGPRDRAIRSTRD